MKFWFKIFFLDALFYAKFVQNFPMKIIQDILKNCFFTNVAMNCQLMFKLNGN